MSSCGRFEGEDPRPAKERDSDRGATATGSVIGPLYGPGLGDISRAAAGEAGLPLAAVEPSPALSQLKEWPGDGRTLGLVTDGADDLDGVREVRQAVLDAGMTPLAVW